jgi:hypothetical protein
MALGSQRCATSGTNTPRSGDSPLAVTEAEEVSPPCPEGGETQMLEIVDGSFVSGDVSPCRGGKGASPLVRSRDRGRDARADDRAVARIATGLLGRWAPAIDGRAGCRRTAVLGGQYIIGLPRRAKQDLAWSAVGEEDIDAGHDLLTMSYALR